MFIHRKVEEKLKRLSHGHRQRIQSTILFHIKKKTDQNSNISKIKKGNKVILLDFLTKSKIQALSYIPVNGFKSDLVLLGC